MKEAARLLGMPYTTYVNYEKGLREPTSEVLIQLADFYDTSIDYLVGRSNNHIRISIPDNPNDNSFMELSPTEKQLIKKFRALDGRGQSAVLNVVNHEYDSLPGENSCSTAKEA